jgi:hypothetical protein
MQYEEWLCVTKGRCVTKTRDGTEVVIEAGETAHIKFGSTWKPTFPVETSYIAICKPAFRPDRCGRERLLLLLLLLLLSLLFALLLSLFLS